MPKYQQPSQKSKAEKTKRNPGQDAQPASQKAKVEDTPLYLTDDLSLSPQIQKHLSLLSGASSDQRVTVTRHLQRTYGNQYVQRLLDSMNVQAKLTVGAAGNIYEQEADRVAEMVTKTPAVQKAASPEEEIQTKLQRAAPEEEEAVLQGKLQRQELPEEEEIQMTPASTIDPTSSFEVGGSIEQTIESQKGNGTPLSGEVRSSMEPVFGADFSGVRVHTGTDSTSLNRQLSARAFTREQDIYMGEGEYSPDTTEGKKLIAHELTHVVQQTDTVRRQLTTEQQRQIEARTGPLTAPLAGPPVSAVPESSKSELRAMLLTCFNSYNDAAQIAVTDFVRAHDHAAAYGGLVSALLSTPLSILGACVSGPIAISAAAATSLISIISSVPESDDPVGEFGSKMRDVFNRLTENRNNSAETIVNNYCLNVSPSVAGNLTQLRLNLVAESFPGNFHTGESVNNTEVSAAITARLEQMWGQIMHQRLVESLERRGEFYKNRPMI